MPRTLHILPWDRPLLERAVAYFPAGWSSGALDLSEWMIVVPTKQAGRRLREALAVHAAERGGAVVGYAFCIHKQFVNDNNMTDIKTLYIDDLCVDERARGGHIGTRLYEYVLDFARQQGYYNVTLNVWADNVNARKFYEKIGLRVQKIGMEKIL